MARMMIKCVVAKEPRIFNYKDKEGRNLWVQDLDNEKLRLPLTAFDTGNWPVFSEGDRFEVTAKVSKRKNDRSGEWEYQFVVDKILPLDTPVEDDAEEADIPF